MSYAKCEAEVYIPTLEEIEEQCILIQQEWSESERNKRRAYEGKVAYSIPEYSTMQILNPDGISRKGVTGVEDIGVKGGQTRRFGNDQYYRETY